MINRLLLLAGPLALLAGCVETRLPVTEGRISTAAEFETTVVNREFIAPDERLAILPRGRFSGQDRSSSFAGRWTFQDGQLCLTRTAPAQGTAPAA